jgi:alpha-tubulin suppressor-like RCC1 family protein
MEAGILKLLPRLLVEPIELAHRALTPVRPDGLDEITSADGGAWYTLAKTSTGDRVYAWGRNVAGQLGDGTTTDRPTPIWTGISDAISVSAYNYHSMVLAGDRSVWQWGVIGTNNMAVPSPTQVPALTDVYQIAPGSWHSLALRGDGTVGGQTTGANWESGTPIPPRSTTPPPSRFLG